ncbi:mitochondrial ATP synthase g subunit-domain-containing protein [Protomyces lactucae-debilis]|uniref:Mitochondrial ATP synthase g subunit-domain-containing protein n=1 Tax=Protomyces lactucae-debilis TaxID=2754530 RepID=A0A1Y2FH65_PROLT|nr:mitochondrial ATP synthase g subunit-domain-containing protein [Protomyces lactucae-debilis]ORY82606.1 mitochondrial ATP synthase g subunit-domain-containing protein [Protomyces lactucae-debilis]
MFRHGLTKQSVRQASRQFARNESSSATQKASEAAGQASAKATETAQAAKQKASEAAGAAQEKASQAAAKAGAVLSSAGARVSGATRGLMGLQEPVVYYAKVVGQLAKQVYLKEGMAPPSMAQFEQVAKNIVSNGTSPKGLSSLVGQLRGLKTGEMIKLGADGLVIYGFFCIGEMIGRRNLVGYDV